MTDVKSKNNVGHQYFYQELIQIEFKDDLVVDNDTIYFNDGSIQNYGDLSDGLNITRLIRDIKPDEIYNLAAMSHVRVSFDTPEYTANIDGLGTLRILEAVRLLGLEKTIIFLKLPNDLIPILAF